MVVLEIATVSRFYATHFATHTCHSHDERVHVAHVCVYMCFATACLWKNFARHYCSLLLNPSESLLRLLPYLFPSFSFSLFRSSSFASWTDGPLCHGWGTSASTFLCALWCICCLSLFLTHSPSPFLLVFSLLGLLLSRRLSFAATRSLLLYFMSLMSVINEPR